MVECSGIMFVKCWYGVVNMFKNSNLLWVFEKDGVVE